jgi:RHS repeat-associated protein
VNSSAGDPFGATPANANPSTLAAGNFTFNLRFAGQYFDKESGLHYNHHRDYDPTLGRYVQSDLIGLAGGLNTYLYVGADPNRFVDPKGLITSPEEAGPPPPEGPDGSPSGSGCGDSKTDGYVPDNIGNIDFSKACKKHDECYGRCGSSKQECDDNFYKDMIAQCGGGFLGAVCTRVASFYKKSVEILGDSAYKTAQKTACANCEPKK